MRVVSINKLHYISRDFKRSLLLCFAKGKNNKKSDQSCFHVIFYIIYTIQTHYYIIKDVDSTVSNFFSSSTQSISEFSL